MNECRMCKIRSVRGRVWHVEPRGAPLPDSVSRDASRTRLRCTVRRRSDALCPLMKSARGPLEPPPPESRRSSPFASPRLIVQLASRKMSPDVRKVDLNQAELRTWKPATLRFVIGLPPAPKETAPAGLNLKHSFVRKLVLVQLSTRASELPASVRISHVRSLPSLLELEKKVRLLLLFERPCCSQSLPTHCLSCSAPEDRFASLAKR